MDTRAHNVSKLITKVSKITGNIRIKYRGYIKAGYPFCPDSPHFFAFVFGLFRLYYFLSKSTAHPLAADSYAASTMRTTVTPLSISRPSIYCPVFVSSAIKSMN